MATINDTSNMTLVTPKIIVGYTRDEYPGLRNVAMNYASSSWKNMVQFKKLTNNGLILVSSVYCVKIFDYFNNFNWTGVPYELDGYTLFQDSNNPDYTFKMKYLGTENTDTGRFQIYFKDTEIRGFISVTFLNQNNTLYLQET